MWGPTERLGRCARRGARAGARGGARAAFRGTVHHGRCERGASAVEFALILTPLLTLIFGLITYGFMLSFRQAVSQGAAEGARAAAIWKAPYAESQQTDRRAAAVAAINDALNSYGVACTDPGVVCDVEFKTCDPGATCAEVEVTYPYGSKPLTPKLPFVPTPDSLSYTAEVRVT